jgi:type IV secretory pathway VirB10-like protein
METTEGPARQTGRPRPWLLFALLAVVVLFAISRYWPGTPAGAPARPSNPRTQTPVGDVAQVDPAQLDVQLEALTAEAPVNEDGGRNPFRFRPPPPPPPPPPPERIDRPVAPPPAPVNTGPPPPPPIPLKFIGIVEPKPGDRVAAFSDCKGTMHAREGQIVLGQYRLVKLGLESVVMEYADGRGRETIRLSGQECVGK